MSIPAYSDNGIFGLAQLYGKPIVCVEGKEDIPFWQNVFDSLGFTCKVHPYGKKNSGKPLLKKFCPKIIADNENTVLAALDRDYMDFTGENIDSNKIFITPGHSIENSFYCEKQAIEAIFRYACSADKEEYEKVFFNEKKKFKENFLYLLLLDIANEKFLSSTGVLNTAIDRFYKKNDINREILDIFVSTIERQIGLDQIATLDHIKKTVEQNFFVIIRGHFLASWYSYIIRTIIKKERSSISISNESLRVFFLSCPCSVKCANRTRLNNEILEKLVALGLRDQ